MSRCPYCTESDAVDGRVDGLPAAVADLHYSLKCDEPGRLTPSCEDSRSSSKARLVRDVDAPSEV